MRYRYVPSPILVPQVKKMDFVITKSCMGTVIDYIHQKQRTRASTYIDMMLGDVRAAEERLRKSVSTSRPSGEGRLTPVFRLHTQRCQTQSQSVRLNGDRSFCSSFSRSCCFGAQQTCKCFHARVLPWIVYFLHTHFLLLQGSSQLTNASYVPSARAVPYAVNQAL